MMPIMHRLKDFSVQQLEAELRVATTALLDSTLLSFAGAANRHRERVLRELRRRNSLRLAVAHADEDATGARRAVLSSERVLMAVERTR